MYNRVREIPRTYADMGYRLQRFRVILMTSIAIMIVVTAVCLFVHPTSGGALLVLALGGSLAALILDYRRRERERKNLDQAVQFCQALKDREVRLDLSHIHI